MALHKDFPQSPHEILDPGLRWFPADEALRETSMEKLMPPLVAELRRKVNYWAVNFKLDYVKADGDISNYYPDFLVKQSDKRIVIVETKGQEDLDDLDNNSTDKEVTPIPPSPAAVRAVPVQEGIKNDGFTAEALRRREKRDVEL